MLIALSMGELAGIATEFSLKAWLALRESAGSFFLMHDPDCVAAAAVALNLPLPIQRIQRIQHAREAAAIFPYALPIFPMPLLVPALPGLLKRRNAPAVIYSIRRGVEFVRSAEALALVTSPI